MKLAICGVYVILLASLFIYYCDLRLPAHCGYRGLLLHLITVIETHTHTHALGMAPLDKESACRRDLYLETHITHTRQTSVLKVGFEPAIPASERPQTQALDRAFLNTEFWGYKQFRCITLFLNVVCIKIGPEPLRVQFDTPAEIRHCLLTYNREVNIGV